MTAPRRSPGELRRAVLAPERPLPGVVTRDRIAAHGRLVRERKMRLALETIAKLDTQFDDAADAARAAIAIAKEALK